MSVAFSAAAPADIGDVVDTGVDHHRERGVTIRNRETERALGQEAEGGGEGLARPGGRLDLAGGADPLDDDAELGMERERGRAQELETARALHLEREGVHVRTGFDEEVVLERVLGGAQQKVEPRGAALEEHTIEAARAASL